MAVPRYGDYHGWPVLAAGFRPFFLLGAIQAAVAILIWLPIFYGELRLSTAFMPRDWHVHEMLYGYLPAIITGFLFTAIPNWTGRLPLQGTPLLTLVVVWLAGRIVVAFSADMGWWLAMLVDASFLLLVAAAAAREIVAGKNWRNLTVVLLVLLLFAGNLAFHLEAHFAESADYATRVGISVIMLLISLIGGRIIPSFTRNWLVRQGPGRLPIPFSRFDKLTIATSAASLLFWIVAPDHPVAGIMLALAGVLQLVRLLRWAGERTFRERLLLILHIGYVFIGIGFFLNAAAAFDLVPVSAGIHAWMAGGAGIMTLAVMTRATLGRTGQVLTASCPTEAIYLTIIIAAVARIWAVLDPAHSEALLYLAGLSWTLAFFGFVLAYGPLLVGSRRRAAERRAPA